MFKVKVVHRFNDVFNPKKVHTPGEILTINDEKRLRGLLGDNAKKLKLAELIEATCDKEKKGPQIIFYQTYLYHIGGIETFLFNFCKHFKDRNIKVVIRQTELEPIIRLSQYCDVEIEQIGKTYETDICIIDNYNGLDFLKKCKSKHNYLMIHVDMAAIKQISQWSNLQVKKTDKIDKIIAVSDTAQAGLKKAFGYDSEVIYNILEDDVTDGNTMFFITLSRATAEKGIKRIIQMAKEFKKQGKNFIWFLGCTLQQATPDVQREIKEMREFIVLPPSAVNKNYISHCDYLVQLSDTESFCYSAYEALQRGTPVILTRFPEASKVVEEGKNGYLVNFDLSDLDVDKIFNHKPKHPTYTDYCDYDKWEKVFEGTL